MKFNNQLKFNIKLNVLVSFSKKSTCLPKKFEPLFKNDFLGSSFSFESNKRLVPQLDFCVGFDKRVLA